MDRRAFLKGTAWMGAAAVAAGCVGHGALALSGSGGAMSGFACAPLRRVRVGFAGLGGRGTAAMNRISQIPGCEVTGLCDLRADRIADCNAKLAAAGRPRAAEYCGPEAYKAMCDADDVDVVYVAGDWQMHCPVAFRAIRSGKHTLVEVPAAFSIDECWEYVELAEKHRVHAMMLENCCYGEAELLCLNLCRSGMLGELVHGEAAYIHDLREMNYADDPSLTLPDGKPNVHRGYYGHWRLKWNVAHGGNQYPTHGLGPVCQYMNVNRGDRLEYLCSVDSNQANFEAYAKELWPAGDWHGKLKVKMGDMNTAVVKTALGRTIMVQHDVSSPRPYSRHNVITGTRGIFRGGGSFDYDVRRDFAVKLGWEDRPGGGVHRFFDRERTEAVRAKFCHPYWKSAGEIAQKIGGHGGMDFLMDLRWVYCLQNGLPMDMDVYDLASWCSLCELTETSARERRFVEVPDFTRGGWKSATPLGIVDVDVKRLGLGSGGVVEDSAKMDV